LQAGTTYTVAWKQVNIVSMGEDCCRGTRIRLPHQDEENDYDMNGNLPHEFQMTSNRYTYSRFLGLMLAKPIILAPTKQLG